LEFAAAVMKDSHMKNVRHLLRNESVVEFCLPTAASDAEIQLILSVLALG